MNRDLINKSVINLLVIIAWLSESAHYQFDVRYYITVAISFVCSVLIQFEKRQGIQFLFVAIAGVITGLCCFGFFFYATPALLMLAAYREETENLSKDAVGKKKERKKETLTGTYLTFAVLLMFVGAIYAFLKFSGNKTDYKSGLLKISGEFIVLFVTVFIVLISAALKDKKKKSNYDKGLKTVYVLALIGITQATVIFIIKEDYETVTARFPLVFWLIFVLSMIENRDVNINNLSKNIKAIFERDK